MRKSETIWNQSIWMLIKKHAMVLIANQRRKLEKWR